MSEINGNNHLASLTKQIDLLLSKPEEEEVSLAEVTDFLTTFVNLAKKQKPQEWQAGLLQLKSFIEESSSPEPQVDDTACATATELKSSKEQLQNELINLRQAVAQGIASEKQLEQQLKKYQDMEDTWKNRAMLADSHGNPELVRQARERQDQYGKSAAETLGAFQEMKQSNLQAREKLGEIEALMQRMNTDELILTARLKAATAQIKVNEILSKMDTESRLKIVSDLEKQVIELEEKAGESVVSKDIQTTDPNLLLVTTVAALARTTAILERLAETS